MTTHFHVVPRSRMCEAMPPLPNTPSWRGSQSKHRNNFTFTLRLTVMIIEESPSYKQPAKFYPTSFWRGLTPHFNEITGDHQCTFRRNRYTTDQIFYIRQVF
jgi:hypothetical protein